MDKILEMAVGQVPALVVLVWLVHYFLRNLKERDHFLRDIGEGCHEVQRDAIETIKENTRVLGEMHTYLKHLNGKNSKGEPK